MVIAKRGHLRSVVPFCGVFLCLNDEGNRRLRDMEPPRHDAWDPNHPEKGANKKTESEYMNFIRECIRKLVSVDDSKLISVPGLNRFLPDDDDTPEDAFDGAETGSQEESAVRLPFPAKVDGRKIDPRRQQLQADDSSSDGGDEETQAGDGDNGWTEPTNTNGGNGDNGAGDEGKLGRQLGSKGGGLPKPSIPVRYRTYATNNEVGLYSLIVSRQSDGASPVVLAVAMVGDDQKAPAEIAWARLEDGTSVPVIGTGRLGPIQLEADRVLRLEIGLSEPNRIAMEISAHEA